MSIYRKIYQENYGAIPKEPNGRTYEIHHIDGNHANNHPTNLKAVTLQEHYDIHLNQDDWGACLYIATRLNKDPKILSNLATQENLKRVKNNNHPFLGSTMNETLLAKGMHPSQNPKNRKLFSQTAKLTNKKLIELGIHQFSKHNKKVHICPHCNKQGKSPVMFRYHFDKCKSPKVF